ncbi:MAG: argininosuccinate synthase, partial [Odoribacter laneus]
MFLHEAMYSEPVMRDIERFLENSQRNVSGKVKIQLRPYHFDLIGIESVHDLMNSGFAEYGEMNNAWTSDDVKGFTKMIAMPLKIYNAVNHDL